MSVINKMLRDLDKRGGLGPRSLEEGVRDVERVPMPPEDEPRPWGRIVAVVAVIGLVAAGAWFAYDQMKPAPVVARNAPAPAPKPAAAAPKAEQPAPPAAVLATPTPPPAPAAAITPPPVAPSPPVVVASAPPATAAPAVPPSPPPASRSADPLQITGAASDAKRASDASVAKVDIAVAEARPRPPPPEPPPPKAARPEPPPPKAAPRSEPAPAEPPVIAAAPAKEAPRSNASTDPGKLNVSRADSTATRAGRAAAEYRSATDQLAQGRVEPALSGYAEALRIDPTHIPARQATVVLLLERGRSAEAQTVLREGIAAMPDNTSWAMLLARLQVDGGDPKAALETLQRSQTYAANNPEYLGFLATLLQMQSRHREAIEQYEASVRLAPDSGRLLVGLGISLEEEKRMPEAREAYRRAIATANLTRDLAAFAERKMQQLQ